MKYFQTFENFDLNPENIEVGDIVCAKDAKVFDDQLYTVLAVGTFEDVQKENHDDYWDSTNSDRITVALLDKNKKAWASISNEEGTLTEPITDLKLVMKKMQKEPFKKLNDFGIL